MAKVKLDFITNANKVNSDLGDLGRGIDGLGGKTDSLSGKFSGIGARIMTAFGPLAVGGAIAKGITHMVDELTQVAQQTTRIAIATRELRGLAGKEGVERMERLAKDLGVEKTVVSGLLSQAISGGAGLTIAEQDQLVTEGVRAEKGKGIPASDLIDMATRTFNADPENFRTQGGVVGAVNQVMTGVQFSNMTAQQGRAMMPAISTAAAVGLPTAQGLGLFAALSQSAATPFEAGTQSRKVLNTFATSGQEGESLEGFLARVAQLSQGERKTLLGEEAGSAPVAFMNNVDIFRETVSKEILAANDTSQAKRAYDESLKDSTMLVADIVEKMDAFGENQVLDKDFERASKEKELKRGEYYDVAQILIQDFTRGTLQLLREGLTFGFMDESFEERALRQGTKLDREQIEKSEQQRARLYSTDQVKTAKSLENVSLNQKKTNQNNNQNSPVRK